MDSLSSETPVDVKESDLPDLKVAEARGYIQIRKTRLRHRSRNVSSLSDSEKVLTR